jgi:hypothetical protein
MLPADFACGYQWYRDSLPEAVEMVPRIVVTLLVEDQEVAALVDTGANQLLLEWTIARPLVDAADLCSVQVRALGGRVHQGVMFPVAQTASLR